MPKISQLPNGGVLLPTDEIPVTRAGATYMAFANPSYVDPKSFGAANNGNTDDTTALQTAFDTSVALNNSVLIGNNAVARTVNLSGISNIPGGLITSTISIDNPTLAITASNTRLNSFVLNVPFATAIQLNTANSNNNILHSIIVNVTDGYAVLDNDAVSDGLIINGCIITSGTADAIECNHPTHPAANRILIGNILQTSGAASGGSAGFAIGLAQVNSAICIGNAIKNSRQAAFHIEDLNTRVVIVGNTVSDAQKEGLTIQVPVPGKGFPDPAVGGFNSFRHTGTKTGYVGINVIGDVIVNVDQFTMMGNCIKGFDYGISASDTQQGYYAGTILLNCNNAVFAAKHARVFGSLLSKGCPIFAVGQSAAVIQGVYGIDKPTSILVKNGTNNPGPIIKEWGYPVPIVHTGSGLETFIIAPLPTKFDGDIQMRIESGSSVWSTWIAHVKWDGTSFTTTVKIDDRSTIAAIAPAQSGGNLQLNITSSTAFTNTMRLEFDGYWYQNS